MNADGAYAPMNQNAAAAARKTIAVTAGDEGSPPAQCTWAFVGAGTAGLAAAGAGGAAESRGGGGGHVIAPSFTTVVPRITSSCMSTLMTPSFALQSSSVSRSRLVA